VESSTFFIFSTTTPTPSRRRVVIFYTTTQGIRLRRRVDVYSTMSDTMRLRARLSSGSRDIMIVQAQSTKTTTFGVFLNSVTYPYPCITLVLTSIRVSPWVFPFLGFLELYFVFLKDYTHAIQMTEVLLLLLLLMRQHHRRALFIDFLTER